VIPFECETLFQNVIPSVSFLIWETEQNHRGLSFDCEFTELHTKLDTDKLLDFASHHRQNETRSQKAFM
jgi:hypothetical protein